MGASESDNGETGEGATKASCLPRSLPDFLREALGSLEALGDAGATHIHRLIPIIERLSEGRLHLAVLGQFKRGKSTFVNALLGAPILPTSIVPLTALPTFVRWGERPHVQVQFTGGRPSEQGPSERGQSLQEFLGAFVTEEGNSKNRKGVRQVDVVFPAPLLRESLTIIDTPGIGSTFTHNTEATLNFLPQCDAALFLVSADPPMTEVEVRFLRRVQERIPRILFVLNKVDYLKPGELRDATAFLRHVLENDLGFPAETPIHAVSARQALEAALVGDTETWGSSGLVQVQQRIVGFVEGEKTQTLELSVARKAADILEEALLQARLTIQSLKLPIQDIERRLAELERKITKLRHERVQAGDLLAGDRKRAHAYLEEESESLRQRARALLLDTVKTELDRSARATEAQIQEVLDETVPGLFERELGTITARFTARTESMLRVHQEHSDRLLDDLRRTAAELFEIPFRAPAASGAFEVTRDPCWISREWTDALSPIKPAWIDRLLSEPARKRRVLDRLRRQVAALVIRNTENLRWSLYRSLDQTLDHFNASLDDRLTMTSHATRDGITSVLERRRSAECTVEVAVEKLSNAANRISAVLAAFDAAALGDMHHQQTESDDVGQQGPPARQLHKNGDGPEVAAGAGAHYNGREET